MSMEFAFTDEQAMIAETATSFFTENATSPRTRAAMTANGMDRDLWHGFCKDLGLGGIIIPEDQGGSGLGYVELAIIAEAAGARVAAIPLLSLVMVSAMINAGGTNDQRARWLSGLIAGEVIGAAGYNPLLEDKDNKITGRVDFIPHGNCADMFLISAKNKCWIVAKEAPGLSVKNHTTMDQTRPLTSIILDSVEAQPLSDSVLAISAGKAAAWLCLAAEALGGAQSCLNQTCDYARDREQFGRQIGSFQAYKHRLADMMVEIEQARSAVYWAACALDEQTDDPVLALHAAKSFCGDTYFKCASDMIQLHGGIGFTWEHDAHLFFKRARSIQSMLESGSWHREQIAGLVLGDAA